MIRRSFAIGDALAYYDPAIRYIWAPLPSLTTEHSTRYGAQMSLWGGSIVVLNLSSLTALLTLLSSVFLALTHCLSQNLGTDIHHGTLSTQSTLHLSSPLLPILLLSAPTAAELSAHFTTLCVHYSALNSLTGL